MKVASISTYADRLDVLPDTVRSLANQVDKVVVYYNCVMPEFKDVEDITRVMQLIIEEDGNKSEFVMNPVNDLADLSKFRAIWDYPEATIYLCDDDLIYNDDYIWRMTKCLHYDTMVGCDVVTLGGKGIHDEGKLKRAKTYRDCFTVKVGCFTQPKGNKHDPYECFFPQEIHIPLSGASALDASKFQDCEIDEKYKYAADIQLGKWIADKGYSCKRAWAYQKKLVTYNPKMGNRDTIFDSHTSKEGKRLSDLVREVWKTKKEVLPLLKY